MHPALAGGPTAVADDPVPVADTAPVAAHDWSGPYIGASLGRASGDLQVFPPVSLLDGRPPGPLPPCTQAICSRRGRMVFGAELSYGKVANAAIVGVATAEYQEAIDRQGAGRLRGERTSFTTALPVVRRFSCTTTRPMISTCTAPTMAWVPNLRFLIG